MKKSFVILLHIGFWLCYFILAAIILAVYYRTIRNVDQPMERILNAFKTILLFAFLPSVISYFFYFFILFPRFFQQKKYILTIVYGIGITVLASIFGYVLLRWMIESGNLIDMDQGGVHGRSTAVRVIGVMTGIGIICGIVAFVIRGFVSWFNELKIREILREKNYEMEMALIKSQIDPHLLFNTINNIDSLILRDADRASEYLNKLSEIMRFVLYETKAPQIRLSREIEYIEKYIDLQKIRTANKDYVYFEVRGSSIGKNIAPMVLIPFMENAFKHSTNKKMENAIKIKIVIDDNTLQLICENRFDPSIKTDMTIGGLGNELIAKRLDLIYQGRQSLNVEKGAETYKINLIVPHE